MKKEKLIKIGMLLLLVMFFSNICYAQNYTEAYINQTYWFNLDAFDTGTTAGVFFYFMLLIILIGLAVFSEYFKLPALMILTGLYSFFYAFLLYTTVSAILGAVVVFSSLIYIIRSITELK